MPHPASRLLALFLLASLLAPALASAASQEILVVPLPLGASYSALSPDGKRIAFLDPLGLRVLDIESRKTRTLLPPGQANSKLAFSPDGESLYFLQPDSAEPGINVLHRYWIASGKSKKVLSRVASAVAFSPDGESMVYLHQVRPGFLELWVASPDGDGERKLMAANFLSNRVWFPERDRAATDGVGRMATDSGPGHMLLTASPQTGEAKSVPLGIDCVSMLWPNSKMGLLAIQRKSNLNGLPYGQIWRRGSADSDWNQMTRDPVGFSELVGVTSDGATLAAMRPVFAGTFFDGMVAAFGSLFPSNSPFKYVQAQHIERFELVLLHLRP